ncbi:hypothetical protein J4E91_001656 [Alternaria rosae]|nr:hypothetical protein J4E91_001656 [Alternaria rosae]
MSDLSDDQYWYIRPGGSKHPDRYLIVSAYTDGALFASSEGTVRTYKPVGAYEDQYFELHEGEGVSAGQLRLHVPATNSVIYSRTDQEPSVGCYHADGKPYPDHWFTFELEPLDLVSTEYDRENGRILNTQPQALPSQIARNGTDGEQSQSVRISKTIERSSRFETEVGLELGVTASFSAGILILAEGKVEISAKIHTNVTFGHTKTTSELWEASVNLTVPAHTTYKVDASITESLLEVPFTSTWKSKKSGVTMTTKGTYKGNSFGELKTNYKPVKE